MNRAQIGYRVGNEHDPGDPFGRCELVIEVDGIARLEQFLRGSQRRWTGRVVPANLDRMFAALEQAGFPAVPQHPLVGGAAVRILSVGIGADLRSATVEYRAGRKLSGYAEVFAVIDAVLCQLSQGTVESSAAGGPAIVTDVTPA